MNSFIYFLTFTYPEVLTVIGTLGNLITLLIFSRKRFEKMRINYSFRAMSILNTILLWQVSISPNLSLTF